MKRSNVAASVIVVSRESDISVQIWWGLQVLTAVWHVIAQTILICFSIMVALYFHQSIYLSVDQEIKDNNCTMQQRLDLEVA